jgi:phosphohistidine swiveling domain-containing protein
MKPPVHDRHALSGEDAENQPAGMGRNGGAREIRNRFVRNDGFLLNALREIAESRAENDRDLGPRGRLLPDRLYGLREEIEKRKNGVACVVDPLTGRIETVSVDVAKEKEKIQHLMHGESHKKDKKIIKGQTGSPGKVRGTCRIVLQLTGKEQLRPGDILVAGATRPEYLPLMKQAAAFVTDEGGITCHAAIVAREMKKPCIIGTKQATRILKDGDMIEVDANKGIITILK